MKDNVNTVKLQRAVRIFLICIISLAILALVFSSVVNAFMLSISRSEIVDFDEIESSDISADYAVILGCRVYSDKTPSVMLRHRLDTGAKLYFSGKVSKIIVSGNPSESYNDEPEAMKNYLISLGVDSEDIIKDDGGLSTYDTMSRASEVFNVKSAVVVSQEYHLYRAMYIGKERGVKIFGASATLGEYDNQFKYDLREYLARCKDFFMALLDLPYAHT